MLHDTELSRSSFRPPRTALAIFLWHSGCCISHGTFQRVFNKPALGLAESPDQLQGSGVTAAPCAECGAAISGLQVLSCPKGDACFA